MNISFPKINKIEISGLDLNEREKIENIIYDANFKNIFYVDKQYLEKKVCENSLLRIIAFSKLEILDT